MGWYIVITEEMRELALKGNDLVVFAALYGFSQKGAGCYYGGQPLLADICGVSLRTVKEILARLEAAGYIDRQTVTRAGHEFCSYSISAECRNCTCASVPECRNCTSPSAESAPQKESIKTGSISNDIEPLKKRRREKKNAIPTIEEVREYCASRRNSIDPEEFVEHYTSNGWMVGKVPMADWKAAVRTWERRCTREQAHPTPSPSPRRQQRDFFLDNLDTLDQLNGTHLKEEYLAQVNGGQRHD